MELSEYIRKKNVYKKISGLVATAILVSGLTACNKNKVTEEPGNVTPVTCVAGKEHRYEEILEPCDPKLNEVYPNLDNDNVCSGNGLQKASRCARCGALEPNSTIVATPYKAHKPTGKGNEFGDKCSDCQEYIVNLHDDWCAVK